jgi:hypothetical protein
MTWVKEVGRRGGDGAWRDDFPLDHELPESICLDCGSLELPIHPMLAVRLRTFVDWHEARGRSVEIVPPRDPATRETFSSMGLLGDAPAKTEEDAIMPVTRLAEFQAVEDVSTRIRELLEYQLTDISPLGAAAFMAVSELCGNAVDHGDNPLGAYAAARRIVEPRPTVTIAIGDLGVGIPEHIRRRYPEWREDGWAIAHATDERITGTDDPHRGFGFSAVLEESLTQSLHSARMEILSASGHCRVGVVQESRKVDVFSAARYRRGTWITYDLISV